MGLMYKVSQKELLTIRNKIFFESGLPALYKNGFQKSPFSTAWFGKDDLKGYTYELCRLVPNSLLETLIVHIVRGDAWIQMYLNIFALNPDIESLKQLDGIDGLQFHLPPNTLSQMRLRSDDYKMIPLFHMLFGKEHKIGAYFTKSGLEGRVKELNELIAHDMHHIDAFINRWHEMHQPKKTDWQGHQLDKAST